MKDFKNVMIFDHPLIRHKVAILRNKNTGMKEFRELIEEITTIMAYEVLKDVPTKEIEVETPLEKCIQTEIVEKSIALVPILRAGLGMVNGIHTLLPTAKVGHIGMYRDEVTMQPKEYYCKLPDGIEHMKVIVLDPMLATGGSASAAISYLEKIGCKDITLMSVIAAPVGVEKIASEHPNLKLFVSTLDRELNEHCYILPGLGDAGDRLYGTK
ncbi:MAG: uracil phosphoribosyltransferase [Clostridia bacterium]|nr:uracil phosphoribosyltransferase [Clostridia bacterium]